tara:strand:+ start:3810 stop:4319 length:510 start_codon:yes stop_codon:yes gene_type:complete
MEDLAGAIVSRQETPKGKPKATPKPKAEVVPVVNRDAEVDLLCEIPAFLDHRRPEVRAAWEKRVKQYEEDERRQRLLQPAQRPAIEMPEWRQKVVKRESKRDRLVKGMDIIMDGLAKEETISGRKLKAKFMASVEAIDDLLETDYERCIRRLCKDRRLWKVGRSYERRR